jgi:hypothetical protein
VRLIPKIPRLSELLQPVKFMILRLLITSLEIWSRNLRKARYSTILTCERVADWYGTHGTSCNWKITYTNPGQNTTLETSRIFELRRVARLVQYSSTMFKAQSNRYMWIHSSVHTASFTSIAAGRSSGAWAQHCTSKPHSLSLAP